MRWRRLIDLILVLILVCLALSCVSRDGRGAAGFLGELAADVAASPGFQAVADVVPGGRLIAALLGGGGMTLIAVDQFARHMVDHRYRARREQEDLLQHAAEMERRTIADERAVEALSDQPSFPVHVPPTVPHGFLSGGIRLD